MAFLLWLLPGIEHLILSNLMLGLQNVGAEGESIPLLPKSPIYYSSIFTLIATISYVV
jgi:hypothetical protein